MIESIDDLIVLLKHFHRNLLADPSLPADIIPSYLPEGLAKIYRELGVLVELDQRPRPFNTQDTLVPVRKIGSIDGMVYFCLENQGCWSACCPLDQKDPPSQYI
jgi:hypothetical protein